MTDIKREYIATLSESTMILFDLADMNEKYTEEERNVWLVNGNASAELLIRSVREYFHSEQDETVKSATIALKDIQVKLEKELRFQKNVVATVEAVADLLAIAEKILIIFSGLRLGVAFNRETLTLSTKP